MNIIGELSEIAAAKYGLQLKDPIFKAFDKLVTDPKFELIKDLVDDDFADFDNAILSYQSNNTTTKTLRNILNLIYILNGRKGFEAKRMVGHVIPEKEHMAYWIDMLGKELLNSSNDNQNDGVAVRGSGVVNGVKMRAAIYHILDILQYNGSIYNDSWVVTLASPCCVFGRGVYRITINGTASGVGYLNPEDDKYYVDVTLRDMFMVYGVNETYTIEIGDEPLGEGDTVTFDIPNGQNLAYSLYLLTVNDFNTDVQLFYIATKEKIYIPGAVREKTGIPPFSIYTVDTSLLDWTITALSEGVGKLGKNYLKPKTTAIPNGSIGTLVRYSGWQSSDGCTFNTGDATKLLFLFKRNGDVALTPSDIGDIMLVEGSTIPTSYDASTTLFNVEITQGTTTRHDHPDTTAQSQGLFCGLDQYGRYNLYGQEASWQNKRCKSFLIDVKPNTDYSVRMFNNAYNDFSIEADLFKAPGTVTPVFTDCSAYTQKSIPGNGTFVRNEEQWMRLDCSQTRTIISYWQTIDGVVPCDVRPIRYEFCNYYATLKAGTYKVMIDSWGNNRFWNPALATGIQDYTGCVEDNFNYTGNQGNEWFALVEENNTVIIQKSDILPSGISSKTKTISDGAPYPNYFHNEITFTLDHDTKVGLIHKAYYWSPSEAKSAYHRFMIVDSDVEAEYFETTGADPAQMQGYSAWEKYHAYIGLITRNEDGSLSQRITINLDDLMSMGDTISNTSTTTDMPTFEGWNTFEVLADGDVEVYVKYQQ